MNISFSYAKEKINFLEEEKIKKLIKVIVKEQKKVIGKIVYHFVSDDEILKINQEFLKHNYFTDIITFDHSFVNIINGEIFISIDTVLTNSQEFKTNFDQEIYRVIIHGVIHLCGYKDSSELEKEIMRSLENKYLAYLEKI